MPEEKTGGPHPQPDFTHARGSKTRRLPELPYQRQAAYIQLAPSLPLLLQYVCQAGTRNEDGACAMNRQNRSDKKRRTVREDAVPRIEVHCFFLSLCWAVGHYC